MLVLMLMLVLVFGFGVVVVVICHLIRCTVSDKMRTVWPKGKWCGQKERNVGDRNAVLAKEINRLMG